MSSDTRTDTRTDTIIRVDIRFSGSFIEWIEGDAALIPPDAAGLAFEYNDENALEDLAMGLGDFGLNEAQWTIMETESAGFLPPERFNGNRFETGATATTFLTVAAPLCDDLTMVIHNAYAMATVLMSGAGLAVYDEYPTVAVNPVTDLSEAVDLRSPSERRADAMVNAIQGALDRHE